MTVEYNQSTASPALVRQFNEAFGPNAFAELLRGLNGDANYRVKLNDETDFVERSGTLGGVVTNLSDDGDITTQRAIPGSRTANVGRVQMGLVISSTDAGSDVTVNISAHTTREGGNDLSFNSGSVSGLAYSTKHWIYVQGAYTGGAVTYLATSDIEDIQANENIYLVGAITTVSDGSSGAISAATETDPAELTVTAHGRVSGDIVTLSSMTGGTWNTLNAGVYTITVTGADTFTIPFDATGLGTFTSGTATFEGSDPGGNPGGGGVLP